MKGQLRAWTIIAGALVALAPAAVRAESLAEPTEARSIVSDYGGYFLVGGGVTDYFDHAVRSRVDTGGTWDVRLGVGNRQLIGGELAYTGSARDAGSLGNDLYSNGVEGVLRLQYPFEQGSWVVEPFAFGGVGWNHFSVNQATSAVAHAADDVLVTPVGAGMMLAYNHVVFDTRFTYRHTFGDNLVKNTDGTDASLKNWAVTASVGYAF
jgi:hypothetical protein